MKIDPTRIQLPGDGQPERITNTGKGGSPQGASNSSGISPTAGQDTVRLSSTHVDVQALTTSLAGVPEIRTDRVQALQQRVQSGQYKPDNAKVADAIIKDHTRLNAIA